MNVDYPDFVPLVYGVIRIKSTTSKVTRARQVVRCTDLLGI